MNAFFLFYRSIISAANAPLLCCFILLVSLIHSPAFADDQKQPIQVTSNHMTYDDLKQISIFTGNVIIIQGSMVIKGNRIEIKQDPQGYQYAKSFGNAQHTAFFRKKRKNLNEYIEGTAQEIDYNGKRNLITFKGNAIIKRLNHANVVIDIIHGKQITYDSVKDFYTAISSPKNTGAHSRVHAILSP